jgi:hypothetical protein
MTRHVDLCEIRKIIEGMPPKERTLSCMQVLNSKKYATSLEVIGVKEPEAGNNYDFVVKPESNSFIVMAGDLQVHHLKKNQPANIFYSTRRVFATSPYCKDVPALWRRNLYSLYAKDLKAFLDTSSRIECPSAFRLTGSDGVEEMHIVFALICMEGCPKQPIYLVVLNVRTSTLFIEQNKAVYRKWTKYDGFQVNKQTNKHYHATLMQHFVTIPQ